MIYDLFDYSDRVAGENAQPFIDMPYIRRMCADAEDCVMGQLPNGKKNLIICIPPRHYKTTFISRRLPAWCLAEVAPDCEFILTSFSNELVTDSAVAVKNIIESPWHQDLYPHLRTASETSNLKHYFKTSAGGSVYSASIGGVITGFGAGKVRAGFGGAIIIDDPIKASNARSEVLRKTSIEYFNGTLKSRRNSIHNTPIIIIMQRLHPDDLVGWILANEPEDWHLVTYPAVDADDNLLNPVTTSHKFLEDLKEVSPHTYWAQYMQSPIVQGGNIIKTNWWRTYKPEQVSTGGLVFLTADTAYKSKEESDRSVIRAWGGTRDSLYCLDAVYGRWEFPELLQNAREFWGKWVQKGAREFWVEDKASGTPLAQTLRNNGVPADDWKPSDFGFPDDKVGRMNEAAWTVHGGHVLVPEGPAQIKVDADTNLYLTEQARALVEECAAFSPDMSHSHDDHCDTLTMAVSLWRDAGGGK